MDCSHGPAICGAVGGAGDHAGRRAGARHWGEDTTRSRHRLHAEAKATPPARPPAAEAGLLPWQLAAPLSREVVLPRGGGRHGLVVLGGLRSGDSSTNAVEVLDTRTGALSPHGSLLQATHDAAGATLGSRLLVIGGGTTAPAGVDPDRDRREGDRAVARCREARADAGAVTIGHTVYVVGGYDGPAMDREVLATTDGRQLSRGRRAPVPVRYPALAVLGSRIYVFGGLGANGHPSDAVQLVDPAGRTARVVGRLPRPLDGRGSRRRSVERSTSRAVAPRRGRPDAVYAFEPRESLVPARGVAASARWPTPVPP